MRGQFLVGILFLTLLMGMIQHHFTTSNQTQKASSSSSPSPSLFSLFTPSLSPSFSPYFSPSAPSAPQMKHSEQSPLLRLKRERDQLIQTIFEKDLEILQQHQKIQALVKPNPVVLSSQNLQLGSAGDLNISDLKLAYSELEGIILRYDSAVKAAEKEITKLQAVLDGYSPEAVSHVQAKRSVQKYEPNWLRSPTERPKKRGNIALFKTHKTGSTTLGSILFRFGSKHGRRFFVGAEHYIEPRKTVDRASTQIGANIQLQHHRNKNINTNYYFNFYRSFMKSPTFITILRDPMSRYISSLHYFWEPYVSLKSTKNFLRFREYHNQQCADLGITTDMGVNDFLRPGGNNEQFFVLILERFDESLVLMKRYFNWELEDILYIKLLESCDGGKNWDGLPIKCDKDKKYDRSVLQQIQDVNRLDQRVYDFFLKKLAERIAQEGQSFQDELRTFKQMVSDLSFHCNTEKNWRKKQNQHYLHQQKQLKEGFSLEGGGEDQYYNTPCTQYLFNDVQYEALIKTHSGYGDILNLKFPKYRLSEDD